MTTPWTAIRAPRLLAATAALLLGASALGACSAQPGVAATAAYTGLDGARHSTTIAEKELQSAADELAPLNMTTSSVLELLVSAGPFEEACAAHGLSVGDEEVDRMLDDQVGKSEHSEAARQAMRTKYLLDVVNNSAQGGGGATPAAQVQAEYESIMGTANVKASPRYDDKETRTWLVLPASAASQMGTAGQRPAMR